MSESNRPAIIAVDANRHLPASASVSIEFASDVQGPLPSGTIVGQAFIGRQPGTFVLNGKNIDRHVGSLSWRARLMRGRNAGIDVIKVAYALCSFASNRPAHASIKNVIALYEVISFSNARIGAQSRAERSARRRAEMKCSGLKASLGGHSRPAKRPLWRLARLSNRRREAA